MSKLFRVEMNGTKRGESELSSEVGRVLADLVRQRGEPGVVGSLDNAIALWSGVDDIQKRLEITRSEISALRDKGIAGAERNRAADELRAVVEGTEAATDTILEAAEGIDLIAQRYMGHEDEALRKDGEEIANRVVEIFEACNFQDITGQRVSKVVASLQFIEERIAAMVDVWQAIADSMNSPDPSAREKATEPNLLNGPALEGDKGVVTQDDVDALFP